MNAGGGARHLRRRWDRWVLRTQGRLDGAAADRLLPWAFAGVAFTLYAALAAAAIRSLEGGSGLAPWLQAAWRRGNGGVGAPLGGVDPASGSGSLVGEAVARMAAIVPPEAMFVVVQSAALALAIVPLWRIAREEAHLRVGATSVIVAALCLAPTLHRTLLSSFHPEVVALPALLWALLHGRRGAGVQFWACVAIVLATRADLGLSVAALGLVLWFTVRWRAGLIAAAIGTVWTLAAALAIDPSIPDHPLTPAGEFVARSVGPLAVVARIGRDPLSQLGQLATAPALTFLVVVLAPLLFLPLVAPRRASAAVPALALAMIADADVQEAAQRGVISLSPAAAHIAPAMAFVFVALVFALERIGQISVTRVNVDRRLLAAMLAGATLFFLTEAPTSPFERPWTWGGRDVVDGARELATGPIAEGDAVAASPGVVALVAERAVVVELPLDPADLTPTRIERVAGSVDAVVLDTTSVDPQTEQPVWDAAERRRVVRSFVREGLVEAYQAQGIVLLVEPDDGGQVPTTSG